jgi:hypothetical protein
MDRTKFEYLDSGIHQNILVQAKLGEKLGILSVPPALERVALRLVKRNPKWKLVVDGWPVNTDGRRRAKKFWVYQGSERLGWVAVGHNYTTNGPSITFDSPTLSMNRERKQYNETGSEDTAVRVIEKNFFAKPLEQVLLEQIGVSRGVIQEFHENKQRVLRGLREDINPSILSYVWANIDTLRGELVANHGATDRLIDDTLAAQEALENITPISKATRSEHGWVAHMVLIREGTYYTYEFGAELPPIVSYTTDTLPPNIKGKLGMLKLVEAKNLITGVGARINENTYVVLEGTE